MMKIAIAGTGYVGFVTAVCMAEKGHQVTCVDVDAEKIRRLQTEGKPLIYEKDLDALMGKNKERLTYTTDYQNAYKDADVIFIGVGTPEKRDGSANLSYVYQVAKQIAESAEKDCVVVVKSTVPIGTNEKVEKILPVAAGQRAFAIFPLGYPAEQKTQQDRFDAERIHYVK